MKVEPKRTRRGAKLTEFRGEQPLTSVPSPLPEAELKHYQHVIGNVTQDALNTWAEIWGELQQGVPTGATVASQVNESAAGPGAEPSAGAPFKPSCGWPEFLEKMWILRHYLDFLARFSRQ